MKNNSSIHQGMGSHWDVINRRGNHRNVYPAENENKAKVIMNNDSLITIIYSNVTFFHSDSEKAFYCWLSQIKAVKNVKGFNPSEDHVYIDPQEIDFSQVWSLWSLFIFYKVKGREQLEQLLPYLSEEDAAYFQESLLIPWKKRKLTSKKHTVNNK